MHKHAAYGASRERRVLNVTSHVSYGHLLLKHVFVHWWTERRRSRARVHYAGSCWMLSFREARAAYGFECMSGLFFFVHKVKLLQTKCANF